MALVVKDIVKNFGEGLSETKVLKGINFEVEQGEFVILNGASGSCLLYTSDAADDG
ncbi:hypothetical protein JJK80_02675, partial [Staphylococcus aureus]|nr:hypothetical protein [Staphylococcus aureus]